MRVLIAEDDPVSALLLRRTIEREGHEVSVAVDGTAAWQSFLEERPQLLISDWMMPGLDGPELCRRVRAVTDDGEAYTYVIMLTAKAQDSDRSEAIAAGVDDFLAKPLNRVELSARLRVAERILAWELRLRRASEATAASDRRYRETFESLHDILYQTDPAGVITLMSPSSMRHTGYQPDELVGTPVSSLFPKGSDFEGLLQALRTDGAVNDFEASLQRRDGTSVAVSLNVEILRDIAGLVTAYQGTVRDIQARKTAEEGRDSIFTLSVDMLCLIERDSSGLIPGGLWMLRAANPAWLATLGYEPREVVGRPFRDFVEFQEVPTATLQAYDINDGHGLRDLRLPMRHADGSRRWIDWNAAPPSASGVTYGVGRDVTAAAQAQQEMQEMVEALSASAASLAEQAAELDRLRLEAEYVANHDMLTGAISRRAWFAQAPQANPVAVAIFDIDFFKRVNDTHGHPIGDLVLREVAWRLEGTMADGAVVGRVGGEEFAAYFVGGFAAAREMAEAAIVAIAASPIVLPSGEQLSITISGGLAPWRVSGAPEDDLAATYDEADRALYAAKAAGRRRLTVYGRRAPTAA